VARWLNRRTAERYDRVVCTTEWAAREFAQFAAPNVDLVPLGVDLKLFHPSRFDPIVRARYAKPDEILLVCCTRLSVEKRPQRALTTLATLLDRGVKARLVLAGHGPLRPALEKAAADLPVEFTGWVSGREELAALQASADVVLAPGPIETFGLAALEALACGSPVVVSASSALPGVIGAAGISQTGEDFADGVMRLLAQDEEARRYRARQRAERYSWDNAVRGFLGVHERLR
jgi:alpha-1,6-mannosyltransferase